MSAGSLVCSVETIVELNEIPKDRAVTDRDSLTVTHSLAVEKEFKPNNERDFALWNAINARLDRLGEKVRAS